MKLSKHFDLEEFTKGNTIGEPSAKEIECMRQLCVNILEPVREYFGKPVIINSGYRSVAHEFKKGRHGTSQHCKGQAADIEIPGVYNVEIWLFIKTLLFDQLIAEKLVANNPSAGWIHVSYVPDGRGQALSFIGDRYVNGLEYMQ